MCIINRISSNFYIVEKVKYHKSNMIWLCREHYGSVQSN